MNTELIINRLKEAKKITTDAQLATVLGVKPNTLSTWKTRNSLDLELIFSKCEDISLDWLIFGRGDMFYSQNREQTTPSGSSDTYKAIADERERTIKVLQDTNKNLLEEIQQLRAYVHITSAKYIQTVEQTFEAAKQTNGTVQQLQAQIGFHHAELHGHIAAHHKDKKD